MPQPAPLPAAYGTGALYLVARDPRSLFAQWDLAPDEQRKLNALSADGHLVLRLTFEGAATPVLTEVHVHPESRHWFLQVPQPGASYLAELGLYLLDRSWVSVAKSQAIKTPHEGLAEERSARFEALPPRLTIAAWQPLTAAAAAVSEEAAAPRSQVAAQERAGPGPSAPGAEMGAPRELPVLRRAENARARPEREWRPKPGPDEERYWGMPQPARDTHAAAQAEMLAWSDEQEQGLYALLGTELMSRSAGASAEIAELVKRAGQALARRAEQREAGELPFEVVSSLAAAGPGEISSPTSPAGAVPGAPGAFWFNVNAELVVYGATEPDALVDIGGRSIRLRPDGTFSYRFALPDGNYELPMSASSVRTAERRVARLEFSRATEYRGEVGVHPQDPNLRVASPENVQ